MKYLSRLLLGILALALPACAWIQSHPSTVAAIETDLVKVGASIAQVAASNGTLNYAQAIPLGLNSITDVIAGMNTDAAAAKIGTTVNQFSAWTLPAAQVTAITHAYVAANPQTPATQRAFLIAAAGDLSRGMMPPPPTAPVNSTPSARIKPATRKFFAAYRPGNADL